MLNVLYEDNHIIAVEKPAGVLTQETAEELDSLENRVKQWLKIKYQKPGNVFLGVIHRLDRPVAGIVLFAKTSKALSRLNAMIRLRQMHKTYKALVQGAFKEKTGTLEHFLRHDDFRATVCLKHHPEAKLARLHYAVVDSFGPYSLVEIDLETGRYHQIRAQFAATQHPVVGDLKYGSKKTILHDGIALQHVQLKLLHPVTKEPIVISCPELKWKELL